MRIGDIFKISKGKKAPEFTNTPFEGAVRFIQIDDLRNNDDIKYCVNDPKLVRCKEDDVILAWDGANAGTIGYGLNGLIGSTLAKLTSLRNDVYTPYVGYFLKSKFKYLRENCTGATIPHISKQVLTDLEIPLPPLAEQKRIAEVLDKADRLRQKDRQLLQKYDQLLQSVFLDMFGDPVKNEKEWEVITLGSIGKWQSGGTPSRSNANFFNGDIPWLSSGELNEMYVETSKEFITEEAVQKSNAKLIEPGSLLLGMYDTAALKSTITKSTCTCNQAIAYSKIDSSKADSVFIYYLIQQAKEHYKSQQRGVRQKNLNISMVKDLKIISPPLELQKRFSKTLNQIEISRNKIREVLNKEEKLFQSLLQNAFKGELALRETEPATAFYLQ